MTYDNAKEIRDLAERHGFATRLVPMKSTHHTEMSELIIGRDLSWLRVPDKNVRGDDEDALQICLDLLDAPGEPLDGAFQCRKAVKRAAQDKAGFCFLEPYDKPCNVGVRNI